LEIDLPELMEPGSEVSIILKAKPNSIVALLAVDRKTSALKSGNDEIKSKLEQKVGNLKFSNETFEWNRKNMLQLLDKSNVLLLSDADWTQTINQRSKRSADASDDIENETVVSETWIFESFKVGASGLLVVKKKVPEAFTSYTISGFSMNTEDGVGFAEPKTVKVTKDFYIELDTPKLMFVGEVLKVKVLVYSATNFRTTLELSSGTDFELVDGSTCPFAHSSRNTITIPKPKPGVTEADFYIRAIKQGPMTIEVHGKSGYKQHTAKQTLNVLDRKFERSNSKGHFFDLRNKRFGSFYFNIRPEPRAVEGSITSEATVVGNLLRQQLEKVENLL
jgi:hypothetical protein